MLEQCIDVFHQLGALELANQLSGALTDAPLEVPADFKGAETALMYRLSLSPALRHQGLDLIQQAVEMKLESPLTQGRGLGGFEEVWREFVQAQTDGLKTDGLPNS